MVSSVYDLPYSMYTINSFCALVVSIPGIDTNTKRTYELFFVKLRVCVMQLRNVSADHINKLVCLSFIYTNY
jgi:hypothetical protein